MNRHCLHFAMLAVSLGCAALVGCKQKETPATQSTAANAMPASTAPAAVPAADTAATSMPAPAEVSVSDMALGNAIGADRHVTAPKTSFSPKDTIYAAVATHGGSANAPVSGTVGVKWTNLDTNQVVQDENWDADFKGDDVTNFQISDEDGWPTGRYKVEILVNGSVVQTREFHVK